jgi:hypothetical protein
MRRAPVWALILALVLSSGCFSIQRKVQFSETERLKVTFENVAASRIFSAAYSEPAVRHADWTVTVSPLLLMNFEVILHEKEWYNHLVRTADINRDSVITEEEAGLLPLPPAEEG